MYVEEAEVAEVVKFENLINELIDLGRQYGLGFGNDDILESFEIVYCNKKQLLKILENKLFSVWTA